MMMRTTSYYDRHGKKIIPPERGPSSYSTSPIIRALAEPPPERKVLTWTEVRINGGAWMRLTEFVGPTSPGTYVIEHRTQTNVCKSKIKSGGKRGAPMKYRVHMVWNLGRAGEEWVPLSAYRHLASAYQRITKMRMHTLRQRMHRENLRTPTFFIEFLKFDERGKKKKSHMVRAFDLNPEGELGLMTQLNNGMSTGRYFPSDYVFMPSAKLDKTKRKASKAGPPWLN